MHRDTSILNWRITEHLLKSVGLSFSQSHANANSSAGSGLCFIMAGLYEEHIERRWLKVSTNTQFDGCTILTMQDSVSLPLRSS